MGELENTMYVVSGVSLINNRSPWLSNYTYYTVNFLKSS